MTANEFFETFSFYQKSHKSYKTWLARTSLIRHYLLPEYGREALDSITSADINHIYDVMEKRHLAPNTIFGCYAALGVFFEMAAGYGYAAENPVRNARHVRPDSNP